MRARKLGTLAVSDLRNLLRDPAATALFAMPVGVALVLRVVLPWVSGRSPFVAEHQAVIAALLCTMLGIFPAMLVAFAMLDEKDANLFDAFRVTPLSAGVFMAYRVSAITVLAAVGALAAEWLAGAPTGLGRRLVVAGLVGMSAAGTALAVVAFARSKIEGVVALKVVSIVILLAAAATPWAASWKYLLGAVPPFWTFLLFTGHGPSFELAALAGGLTHLLFLLFVYRQFRRRVF